MLPILRGAEASLAGAVCARIAGSAIKSRADTLRVRDFIMRFPFEWRQAFCLPYLTANSGSGTSVSAFGKGFAPNVEYRAMPVNRDPERIFPMVTGTWFQSHQFPKETGA